MSEYEKRWDNGELRTKDRMEDEPWYYANGGYQEFMEYSIGSCDIDEIYEGFIKDHPDCNKEQILRWATIQADRHAHFLQEAHRYGFKVTAIIGE